MTNRAKIGPGAFSHGPTILLCSIEFVNRKNAQKYIIIFVHFVQLAVTNPPLMNAASRLGSTNWLYALLSTCRIIIPLLFSLVRFQNICSSLLLPLLLKPVFLLPYHLLLLYSSYSFTSFLLFFLYTLIILERVELVNPFFQLFLSRHHTSRCCPCCQRLL